MIRIVIVDDDILVVESLSIILGSDRECMIVGSAMNGQEAVKLLENIKADVILMDIQMPVLDGISACKTIKERHAEIRIIMLTTFHDYKNIHLSLKAGASGYLLKSDSTEKQIMTIKSVYAGLPTISEDALVGFREDENDLSLTSREKDVMELVANGFSNKEISDRLYISEGTVRNMLSVILGKMELRDRTQLAIFYWQSKTGFNE